MASTSVTNGHEPEKRSKLENQSPPRFTAVNGRELTATMSVGPTAADSSSNEEISINQGRVELDAPFRAEERARDNGNAENDPDERSMQRSTSHSGSLSGGQSANKRKRSEIDERQELPSSSSKGSRSPAIRSDAAVEFHTQPLALNIAVSPPGPHDPKHPSPSIAQSDRNEDSRSASANASLNDYDSHLVQQAQRAQQIDPSDAQLAEVLQRESQDHDGQGLQQKSWSATNRSTEGPAQTKEPLHTFSQEQPQAAIQVAPKRKRVFSNRTKTGCMTCRRRKKKCDEQHPACNNCLRGGFLCEGYSSRSTWQKPSSAKTPVPLQSKEGYPDLGAQYVHDLSQQHERPQTLAEQLDAGKMRAIVTDENDRVAGQFNASPTGANSARGPWSKRSWPNAGHTTFIPDHVTKSDYREVPSIHELSRDGHTKGDYQIVPSIRDIPHGSHQKPGMSIFQGGIDQRPAHTGTVDTNSPQAQARMALSIEHQLSNRTVSEESEKDKMIRGELYRPFDIHLVEERERCKAAIWRFNNACNPVSGLSAKEQNRLLKEVLIPPGSVVGSPSSVGPLRPAGSIGQGAVVESPFQCHYGFNIHIGEDVMISENCLFVDDCPITIGAHTWIGPRVTVLTSMAHANMQERKGSQSRYQGRPVTIEEDCYVGAGCTIYPGVRLRRGAYVAPGEVVKTDIVAYGFQGLKPSYM
ncbi:nodulation protein L [Aspergillus udagawae]|uniref:Nodulation protein L n=1 Tax=Aspergillus udagawae TaxID=91492 RepID=A0A8H3XS27_9EURO|nr:nodulation protein L [Aspergillus udagawae]